MAVCTVADKGGITWITLSGRIDSMTSPEIQKQINALILDGRRRMLAGFADVTYISSAGLRIFITAQKQLKKAGGEMILFAIPPEIFPVFTMSGFETLFRIAQTHDAAAAAFHEDAPDSLIKTATVSGLSIRYRETDAPPSTLAIIGSQEKLASASYTEKDVIAVRASTLPFGTGLATLGDSYDEYKNLFGETVMAGGNFFFYPAVRRAAVDFMVNSAGDPNLTGKFLHGFGFSGAFSRIIALENTDGYIELSSLPDIIFSRTDANLAGIVLLAESKGLWGMHIMKVPIRENAPPTGAIFDRENFTDWMNFAVEPKDFGGVILCSGIAARDKTALSGAAQSLFPDTANMHLHAAVFSPGPFNTAVERFDKEVARVVTELDVLRVQHLLGRSRIGCAVLGVIALSGETLL